MTDTQTTPGVQLSDVAVEKVRSLLEAEGRDDLSLRIAVQPGGCSGLRYQLYFDDRSLDGDVVTDYNGVSVVTDKMSAPYLGGASIDFMDSIEKQGFTIDNPNAQGSCACGDSFHRGEAAESYATPVGDSPPGWSFYVKVAGAVLSARFRANLRAMNRPIWKGL